VVGLLIVMVGGCAWLIGPIVGTELKLNQDLGPRATSVEFNWNNSATTFVIHLTPGYESQAERIACKIVKPDLRTSSTPDAQRDREFQRAHSGRRDDSLRLTPTAFRPVGTAGPE
jgi:carotenoid cleavage dioxygenase-like enzyme